MHKFRRPITQLYKHVNLSSLTKRFFHINRAKYDEPTYNSYRAIHQINGMDGR